jgi:hypothetical protein
LNFTYISEHQHTKLGLCPCYETDVDGNYAVQQECVFEELKPLKS